MKSRVLTVILILLTCQLHAADYYWVGGGGNWSDLNHWRLGSSAGPIVVPGTGAIRTVSLQGLPAATYLLQVINGKETKTFKVIKQ